MSNDPKELGWGIAKARGRLSELLVSAAEEPQHLYNRGRKVGVIIGPEEYERYRQWKSAQKAPSLAAAFEELRRLCDEEGYELAIPRRTNRANPFPADHPDDEPAAG